LKQFAIRFFALMLLTLPIASVTAFADSDDGSDKSSNKAGALYTATNAAAGNAVLIFARGEDGSLTATGSVGTGGLGTGAALGNQNGIALTHNQKLLFVVNAGSNEISSFIVEPNGLRLVDKTFSGGRNPISLATHGNLLFVLNAGGQVGGSDNITGFSIERDGRLSLLAGTTRPLSVPNATPAQIAFNDDGDLFAVTEKGTSRIVTYTLDDIGVPAGPKVFVSSGATPFGFGFGKRDQLFVSEAASSAASSYSVSDSGTLSVISASVLDHQRAACWLVVSNDGRHAYVANAGTASVSGYSIDERGTLALLNADGVTGVTSPGPVDETFSSDGRFLYTLNARSGAISGFEVRADGSLRKLADTAVQTGTDGFAAR